MAPAEEAEEAEKPNPSPIHKNQAKSKVPDPAQIPLPPTPGEGNSKKTGVGESPAATAVRFCNIFSTRSDNVFQTWFGTWPRKPVPVKKVAGDNIFAADNTASAVVSAIAQKATKPRPIRSPSLQLTLGDSKSKRSLPAHAATTKVHATSTGSPGEEAANKTESLGIGKANKEVGILSKAGAAADGGQKAESKREDIAVKSLKPNSCSADPPVQSDNSRPDSSNANVGWYTWLSGFSQSTEPPTIFAGKDDVPPLDRVPNATGLTGSPSTEPPEEAAAHLKAVKVDKPTLHKRSWLQMWTNDPAPRPVETTTATPDSHVASPANLDPTGTARASNAGGLLKPQEADTGARSVSSSFSKASSLETAPLPAFSGDGTKSSGWVFWSRDKKAFPMTEPHVGELAVSDTPSQKRPKRASVSFGDSGKFQKRLSGPGQGSQVLPIEQEANASRSIEPSLETAAVQEAVKAEGSEDTPAKDQTLGATVTAKFPAKNIPNLVLPSFQETFALQKSPGVLQRLSQLFQYRPAPGQTHLQLLRDPPRVKSAIAIGVHGYFPAPLIRSVLGQPTGTSIKFADMAAEAIKRWTHERGYSCEVQTAALEGEGRISERVELLWKLLLNWVDAIRKADFVMVACHSQGVPVATMLVSKLISFGCVNPDARIGICAMAGVSLGPFADYKSRWLSGSAGELFDFRDPNSSVSQSYLAALEVVLKFGAKVTYIGSIDDQLVSLESSVFSPVSHPHICRAVFIDGRIHSPSFISLLVGFALKLRNLGVPDHGLIRELSSPLAGSLYGGEGHSRVYEDAAVYDLAVKFSLETTSITRAPLTQRPLAASAPNPYILPFAMRGILEEDYVKTELQREAMDLLKQFDQWQPTTKVLKDVKCRLEGIRSKM